MDLHHLLGTQANLTAIRLHKGAQTLRLQGAN